ncbi:hypothetical protein WJX72_012379 [[Myrmecia] bisecta]|uniref:DUF2062 domain-containing protein n=1 Tax=[Myrmecia] bisecta TaxID=41462 RepID=A0AAW1PZK8_9CHLO
MGRLYTWFRVKVVDPFYTYVKQGAEPRLLAWSAAVGFTLGLCPLLGVSTALALLVLMLVRKRLHAPMCLLANFCAIPFEVALIVPFMRLGEFVLRAERLPLAPVAIKDILFNHPGDALKALGHAICGWLVASPAVMWLLITALTPLFAWLKRRFTTDEMEVNMLGSADGSVDMELELESEAA